MKLFYSSLFVWVISLNIFAQSSVLKFDGIDDYISFDINAADNARTIEFWFSLSTNVDSTLQNEIILFGTEIPDPNVDEWHLSITQSGTVNPAGTLRFVYVEAIGQVSQVYSNDNAWEANRWYHAAVVIDSVQGLLLFVDGVMQNAMISSFNKPLTPNNANIEFGRQNGFNRYFEGEVDDLRVSSEARYLEDFIPPCPDLLPDSTTLGLWNFNDNTGLVARDSGPNGYDGQIFGADWSMTNICPTSSIEYFEKQKNALKVYPNPSYGAFYIENTGQRLEDSYLIVRDLNNQVIINKKWNSNCIQVDLSNKEQGLYYFLVKNRRGIYSSGKLINL